MIQVREVLRRWQSRQSIRAIHRATEVDRKTVRRYIARAKKLGLRVDGVLTDAVVHDVAQAVQARAEPVPTEAWQDLRVHDARIKGYLDEGFRLTRVRTLLLQHGIATTYPTLRRYAIRELGWRAADSTILLDDPPPGQEAQIDFAEMARVDDPESGKRRKLHVLIVTLSFSRYQFVWPTFSQTTATIIEGLDAAWAFFGAVPKTLIPDNPKSMVIAADPTAPTLNEVFAEYAQARGIYVDPARVRKPKDKAKVERQVQYVRDAWFAGHTPCDSIAAWRRSAELWCRDVAGARIHGTTRKVPREVFDAEEKPAMLPAPGACFDVPTWTDAVVHRDHHVHVAGALYSVPTLACELARTNKVRVRYDSKTVSIYIKTDLVKMHLREPKGGRATDVGDYPAGKAVYALRSVDALRKEAGEKGEHIGRYAERLLGGPRPWMQMRAAYCLLSLCRKFGAGPVEAVCQTALSFDVVDVKRVKALLEEQVTRAACTDEKDGRIVVPLPVHPPRFARQDDHFRTRSGSSNEGTR